MRVRFSLLALAAACQAPESAPRSAPGAAVSDLAWHLHDEVASLVVATWTQHGDGETAVEVRVDDEDWFAWGARERETGQHEKVVAGVPYDTDFELRLVVDGEPGEPLAGTTGPLPVSTLAPEVVVPCDDRCDPDGRWLLTSMNATDSGWAPGDYYILLLDRKGRVVWSWAVPDQHFCVHPTPALDGRALLWDEITFWTDLDLGRGSEVHRMTLDGTVEQTWPTVGANHAFSELSTGGLAWYAMGTAGSGIYDGSVQELSPGGTQRQIWDCSAYHSARGTAGTCLANTVFWHEASGVYLVSFAQEDFVVEVDRESGETLRVFGRAPDGWDFDPSDAAFYVQHGVSYTADGTLLLSSHADALTDEAIVREYALDAEAATLEEVWSWAGGDGVEARLGGGAERLPSGNTLQGFGTTPRVREITPDGELVWDLAWPGEHLLGRAVLIDDLEPLLP